MAASSGRRRSNGIYCVEVEWDGVAARAQTVRPALELLHQWADHGVPFIHRVVSTRSEFDFHIRRWGQAGMARCPILYLAVHGRPGIVDIGDWRRRDTAVRLDEMAALLAKRCRGRLIHFSSCRTMGIPRAALRKFLSRTGAVAVSGYSGSINWLESVACDLIALGAMQEHSLTARGARAMRSRIQTRSAGLARDLRFRMVIKE